MWNSKLSLSLRCRHPIWTLVGVPLAPLPIQLPGETAEDGPLVISILSFHFFLKDLLFLSECQSYREREVPTHTVLPSAVSLLIWLPTGLGQVETRGQIFLPDLPCGWQGPNHLGHLLLLSISWIRSGAARDMNNVNMGCWCHRYWLMSHSFYF